MRRFRPPCLPDRLFRVAPDPRKGFQWLDLHPFLFFRVHRLPHDPFGRGRVDIRHPSDRSLIRGSGYPDPWIAEGSDMRMTAIGWPCLKIQVTPELKAWEPQVDDEHPGFQPLPRIQVALVPRSGKHLIERFYLCAHRSSFRVTPDPFTMVARVERHRSGAPYLFPGCPGNPYKDIPVDQNDLSGRSLFPGRVTPSFSQGIPREHLVDRSLIIKTGLPRS